MDYGCVWHCVIVARKNFLFYHKIGGYMFAFKRILLLLLAVSCTMCASSKQSQKYVYDENKQLEWRKIKGSFDNLEAFYYASQVGFSRYFKKYSPKTFSKDDEKLIMVAKYGKKDVICIFSQNKNSQYIVSIDTKSDMDEIKWLENVVKYVEDPDYTECLWGSNCVRVKVEQ
jgi:hypothetical protein